MDLKMVMLFLYYCKFSNHPPGGFFIFGVFGSRLNSREDPIPPRI